MVHSRIGGIWVGEISRLAGSLSGSGSAGVVRMEVWWHWGGVRMLKLCAEGL